MNIVPGCRHLLIFLLVLLLTGSEALAQQPADATVQSVGASRIRGGDLSAAREEAINAGLAAAVHRVLTDLLPPEIVVANFQALNETLLNRTDPFVRDYKVLAHSTLAANYRMVVQATISVDRIKEALNRAGIHLVQRQYPSVLFCIAESHIEDLTPRYWWSGRSMAGDTTAGASLSKSFAASGFVIVEPVPGMNFPGYPPELRSAEAVSIGQQLQADVVVVGLARTEDAMGTDALGAPSFRGSITVKAYRVSDGRQIAQTQRVALVKTDETHVMADDTLRAAAERAAEDLTAQIDGVWFQQATGENRIEMAVHGISGNMANFVRFRGALSNLSGVDRLQLKEMTSDAAILNLDFQGNARTLADALLRLGFESFRITIAQLDAGNIHVQLVPK